MARKTSLRLLTSLTVFFLGVGGFFVPAGSAAAQTATTIIQLESPAGSGSASTRLMINGWAADPTGRGAGVDKVQIYLGDPESGGQDLGLATFGGSRPDVARTLGDQRFTNSGFQLAVELPPGQHTIYIYAHLNTAGPEEGWASLSTTFTASASVRPDPQAVALLNQEPQPQVRSAAPPVSGGATTGSGGSSSSRSGFTASVDSSGGIRTTPSRHDPIPLDPAVPGMSSVQSSGYTGPELADPTGSGGSIRQSVVSEGTTGGASNNQAYRTGQVTMTGGGNNTCPGPNCPANTGNMNNQLQQLPSQAIRDLTGYNVPGLGNNVPCTPSNSGGAGACNPVTGTSAAPGAPTQQQLMQQQAQMATMNNNTPTLQLPTNQGPACAQTVGGQCLTQSGAQGPMGSTCLRFVGAQCAYYGATPAAGGAPSTTQPSPSTLLGTAGASGCAQWSGTGQCMSPAPTAAGATTRNDGFIPGLATTYPAGVLTSSTGAASPAAMSGAAGMPVSTAMSPQMTGAATTSIATAPAGYAGAQVPSPASSSGGVCLQFSPSGACTQYR